MRKMLLLVVVLVGMLALGGIAFADGPGGSQEDADTNEVTSCGSGTDTGAGIFVFADPASGAELCSGDGAAPDGRLIVSVASGNEYVAVDGDPTNGPETDGWVRLDADGVEVCDDGGDSTTSQCDTPTTHLP